MLVIGFRVSDHWVYEVPSRFHIWRLSHSPSLRFSPSPFLRLSPFPSTLLQYPKRIALAEAVFNI